MRGERFISAAANVLGGERRRTRIADQASEYWSTPTNTLWESNSHWRDALGADVFVEVGNDHWTMYQTFARALDIAAPGTVIEWGAGGGANAVAFAPHADKFIAADIAAGSLDECVRQVRSVCDTPVDSRHIDLAEPEKAAVGLTATCDTFLCLYVIETTTGPDEVERILRIAADVLVPGGMAFVQMKYHTGDRRTRGRAGLAYTRNIALTTTFTIEEFWSLTAECGLEPELVKLVPQNRLDARYAYYALSKPGAA